MTTDVLLQSWQESLRQAELQHDFGCPGSPHHPPKSHSLPRFRVLTGLRHSVDTFEDILSTKNSSFTGKSMRESVDKAMSLLSKVKEEELFLEIHNLKPLGVGEYSLVYKG